MNARMSIQAYQRAATTAQNPRQTEYRAIAHVTARLVQAKEKGRVDIGALAEALGENRRLWMTLAMDCGHADNRLSPQLRAQIISIAAFVERYSRSVLRDGAELDALIDINRTILEGLAGR
jgi:flagellar protein FlaF